MSRKRLIVSLFFALLAFVFVFSAYARAQNDSQNIIAAASVTVNQGENAQNKAVNAALNNAVLEALALSLPEEIFSKNFTNFAPYLLKDAGQYVESYKVLAVGASGGMTHAIVEASVTPGQVKRALGEAGLLEEAGFLSNIVVFVDANSVFITEPVQWWRVSHLDDTLLMPINTLGNAMAEQGFTFLPAEAAHARAIQAIRNNITPLDTDLAVVGKAVNADAVILGTVTFQSRQDRSVAGNYHINAILDLRVLEVATGKIICNVMQESGMVSDDQDLGASLALMDAAHKAAERLAGCITQSATKPADVAVETYTGEPQKITVQVEGQNRSLTDYTNFRRTLTALSGVSSVNINSLGSDGMRLSFNYSGTTNMLIQRVADFNFPNFTVKVLENGPGFVNFEILDPDDEPQFVLVDDDEDAGRQ